MIEGNIVDVRHKRVFPGRIVHKDGVITAVEEIRGEFDGFIVPGLIDSHIHIESSLMCPSRFAEAVVPHGTTAVITDPHEIANVLGLQGIDYMVKDSKIVPLRTYFTAPSCVPATPFETSGAAFGPREIESLLARDEFVALGEMMNYPGVIARDPAVIDKIEVAKRLGKPIDGHCPMLSGTGLREYVSQGITTDHECTTFEEAREKYSVGMMIMVRQGSASKNLDALTPFAKSHEFFLVSDDRNVSDLIEGHLDRALAQAVANGIDPIHALRAATINPALHYSLPIGAIESGRMADFVRISDMKEFSSEEVYIGGELVASRGVPKFETKPKEMVSQLVLARKVPSDFEMLSQKPLTEVRVVGLIEDSIVTDALTATLRTENGRIVADLEQDVLHLSVVNRYRDAPVSNAFVKGFGLRTGSIASSVAHDSHNIIAVGTNSEDMALAVNSLVDEGGGFCVCSDGKVSMLKLHVAGLMCTKPVHDVKLVLDSLLAKMKDLGCAVDDPFMTMAFLSLFVIPALRLGDRGLFDVTEFRFVDVIL